MSYWAEKATLGRRSHNCKLDINKQLTHMVYLLN